MDPRLVVADRNYAKATLHHASARRISTAISLNDCVGQVSLRDPGLENLKTDPLLDPLRKEPRFKAIERELRFPN